MTVKKNIGDAFIDGVAAGKVPGFTLSPDYPRFKTLDFREPIGTRVRFMDANGYDYERDIARTVLDKESVYTVAGFYVSSFSSSVQLKEVPGRKFNTVMFAREEDLQTNAELDENDPIVKAIDRGGGQACDVAGVLRELKAAGFVIMAALPGEDPAALWDDYCKEVPRERRSPQGALAFGFARGR